ncbi:unnamed protein product, partial [Porites lobata]
MNKRVKDVNWSKLANGSPKPKRLHLEEDDCDGLFHCPVQICNHDGFTAQRGRRKHVKNKHSWYYYLDEKPSSAQMESFHNQSEKIEANDQTIPRTTRAIASFDLKNNITKSFFSWLIGSGGGCKSDRQAQQITKRNSHLALLILAYVHRISYLNSKVNGASETVWRCLSTAEMYLKRARKTVSKMMRLQWTSELDIDALEAKGHWATMEELLEVVGRYLPRYESVLKTCRDKPDTYVHAARCHQIVETASSRTISSNAQGAISEDQKHSSVVARVHHQKRRSREVASKAHAFLERLQGERGSELEMDVRSRLSENSSSSQEQDVGKTDTLMFTPEEDKFLKAGLKRHGFGQWKAILTDPDFQFQKGRTANSLLSQA